MAGLDEAAIMTAIGDRLRTIEGLRVFDYPTSTATPPAAIVGLGEIEYDFTKGRGSDRAVYPIMVLCGKAEDRSARDVLVAYRAGSGASSIKAALDGTLGGVAQTVRVMSVQAQEIVNINGVDYLGAIFDLEVID